MPERPKRGVAGLSFKNSLLVLLSILSAASVFLLQSAQADYLLRAEHFGSSARLVHRSLAKMGATPEQATISVVRKGDTVWLEGDLLKTLDLTAETLISKSGTYVSATWQGMDWVYATLVSAALNLKGQGTANGQTYVNRWGIIEGDLNREDMSRLVQRILRVEHGHVVSVYRLGDITVFECFVSSGPPGLRVGAKEVNLHIAFIGGDTAKTRVVVGSPIIIVNF